MIVSSDFTERMDVGKYRPIGRTMLVGSDCMTVKLNFHRVDTFRKNAATMEVVVDSDLHMLLQ